MDLAQPEAQHTPVSRHVMTSLQSLCIHGSGRLDI